MKLRAAMALGVLLIAGAASAGRRSDPILLVVDDLALGELMGGKWRSPEKAATGLNAPIRFTSLGVGKKLGELSLGKFIVSEGNGATVAVGEKPRRGVFLSGPPASVEPFRRITDLGPYRSSIRPLLRARGATARPVLVAGYEGDLDGDRRDEAILTVASRQGLRMGRPARNGDYTAVLIFRRGARQLTRSAIAHIGVRKGEGGTENWFAEVRAIADMDRDGKQEIALGVAYDLGPGAALLRYTNGRTTKLIEASNDEP
jgi:hypothetical protein